MKKQEKFTSKSLQQIEAAWQLAKTLAVREKLSALKGIGFDIKIAYSQGNLSANELKRFFDVLNDVIRIPNCPQTFVLLRNKIYADWMRLTGNAEPEILQKKLGKLDIKTGQIVIADKNIDLASLDYHDEKGEINLINTGTLFVFGTGGDGVINIQCRVVKAVEPMLALKEYKCCQNSTEVAVINIPSGEVQIACWSGINMTSNNLSLHVSPGHYKVVAHYFCIRNKFDSFYIVLCKTEEDAKNQHQTIAILE